jgi:hypothetical protein
MQEHEPVVQTVADRRRFKQALDHGLRTAPSGHLFVLILYHPAQ